MALKIICLEEHAADPALREAAQPGTARRAPYYTDLNSRFRDDAETPGSLPALRVVDKAVAMTGEPLEQRIAAMDEAGIDVQVLSYTDLT